MTMVERMARAMARDATYGHDHWPNISPIIKREFLCLALAALRELREPTEVMSRAANQPARVGYIDFSEQLRAAIDVAIAEHEGKT